MQRVRLLTRWKFLMGLAVVFVVLMAVLFQSNELPFDTKGFTTTTAPQTFSLTGLPLWQRAWLGWWMALQKLKYMSSGRAVTYTFGAAPEQRCSIHGLLNQAHAVTGIRYLIQPEIAAGSFFFGHTNTLRGDQWVAAVESAIQTGKVEWWDPEKKTFIKENPVLIKFPQHKTVFVFSKEQAAVFQRTNALPGGR